MRDVGIVSFAQSNARREVRNEVEILLPVVKEAVKQSGLARTDIDFTCSASSDSCSVIVPAIVRTAPDPTPNSPIARSAASRSRGWWVRPR